MPRLAKTSFSQGAWYTNCPDPGRLTKLWADGLELYRAGSYAVAETKFREIAKAQESFQVIQRAKP